MLLVSHLRHRSIDLDAFEIPASLPRVFPRDAGRDTSLAIPLERATESIHQAQVIQLSRPRLRRQESGDVQRPPDLIVDVLAALPYALDHYSLRIKRSGGIAPPVLELQRLGDDQRTRRPASPSASVRYSNGSRDSYDSDSTLSRVMQPTQVLDLQISPSGRRAVAIHVAAHSNTRTLWCYSIPEGCGSLVAGRLSLDPSSKSFTPVIDDSTFLSVTGESMSSVLEDHACRLSFNEYTGAVVVAADCEEIALLNY